MEKDCIFCKVIRKELPCDLILETPHFLIIKDVYPKVKGHALVISKEHYETFLDLPVTLYGEFMKAVSDGVQKVLKNEGTKAYHLAMNNRKIAGQLVPHVHMHILPRREGDGFSLKV